MAEAGERVTRECPSCERVQELDVYDIGSGPELSCPHCEWCWGANGQALTPLSITQMQAMVEESEIAQLPRQDRPGFAIRALRRVEARFFCGPEDYRRARAKAREREED